MISNQNYDGKYSITFNESLSLYSADISSESMKAGQLKGTNTWDDWHLIPASRHSVARPSVSTSFVEIPGLSGGIDMSTYLCGRPVYSNRSGSWEFYVENDHEHWETIRMKIMNFLHGRAYKISFEDDPRFYWEGRFSVSDWKTEDTHSRVSIEYTLQPYKIALRDVLPSVDVIWNTFNFERDLDEDDPLNQAAIDQASTDSILRARIAELLNGVTVASGTTVTKIIPKCSYFMSISLTLQSGSGITAEFDKRHATLSRVGQTEVLYSDDLSGGPITLTGNGTVVFGFRERSL